ncbi:MAG: sporulation protein YabP [Oscillospiraceae bacterium]|jgi:sporulation protein YabP|nr:sporulation protein YabP [Oscillospiraceae bacterium]
MMKDPLAEEKRKTRSHSIVMENRRKASLTGVNDVASFHEQEVVLRTDDGEITIVGDQLHISQLSLEEGRLIVEGLIGGLEYADMPQAKQAGFFSRLFH